MKVRALVVAEKDAPFEEQQIDLAEPARGEARVRIVASGEVIEPILRMPA